MDLVDENTENPVIFWIDAEARRATQRKKNLRGKTTFSTHFLRQGSRTRGLEEKSSRKNNIFNGCSPDLTQISDAMDSSSLKICVKSALICG